MEYQKVGLDSVQGYPSGDIPSKGQEARLNFQSKEAKAEIDIAGAVRELYRSPEHAAAAGRFEASVTICFASSRGTLSETILSLAEQEDAPLFELLLVSNATKDDSVEVAIAASRGMPVRILECESLGYDSNARNVCMREAASDKIIFLDSDDMVSARYVASMYAALDHSPLVTGVWSMQRLNAERFPELLRSRPEETENWPCRYAGWTFAPAGTLGMRREVPLTVGGYDPEFLYAANNEWCFRAYAAGFEIVAVPEAVVHYRLRTSVMDSLRQKYRWGLYEVAAAKAASAYGLPRRSALRMMGAGTYSRILMALVRTRTSYDWYNFLGLLGNAAGRLAGSIRYRRLDL